jgi:integrase
MSINPQQIKKLENKAGQKYTSYPDGNGLYLYVYSKDKKWWRFRCRSLEGKQRLISLGTYPAVSLKEAREKAEELYSLRKQGIDPVIHIEAKKQTERQDGENANQNNFEIVAREWFQALKKEKSESHKKRIMASLEKDVFPYIGGLAVDKIESESFADIAKRIESRGAIETAHRVIGRCGEIMLYAMLTGRTKHSPIAAVKKYMQATMKKTQKHMAATTEPSKVGELLRMIEGYQGTAIVKAALKFAPLVFVRPGELRQAEWQDIDLKQKQWAFTASKTEQNHIVPLSRQAVEILSELKLITGNGKYVFPAPTGSDRPMSNNAILAAFRRMGIAKEEHSGHGWRATARTLLDEQLRFPIPIIELQLAHSVKDMHGEAYNRTTYIEDRETMMQAWSDYLDELKATLEPDNRALKEKYRYRD